MNRPDPGPADQGANQDDAVWLDLVARLQADPAESINTTPHEQDPASPSNAAPPRPSFSDFDPLGLAGAVHREPSAAERGQAGTPDSGPLSGPRDYEADDDDSEFVPEDPPSLAGTEPLTMLAWIGAVGGPLTLLLFAMFWRSAPLLAILGVIAAFVAAVGYLIMRLPHEKNDSDDGARV